MAFVCAEADAANCGNDHKTGNEAEAATPWVTLFELRISQFPIASELPASRSGRSLSGRRAVDGGVISERTLPSENAPASIGMGEPSFFCNQRVYRRA